MTQYNNNVPPNFFCVYAQITGNDRPQPLKHRVAGHPPCSQGLLCKLPVNRRPRHGGPGCHLQVTRLQLPIADLGIMAGAKRSGEAASADRRAKCDSGAAGGGGGGGGRGGGEERGSLENDILYL